MPAIVSVPLRAFGSSEYGATAYVTVPSPRPPVAPLIVIHEALLATVHVHPGAVMTATVAPPPFIANVARAGEIS